MREMQNNVQGEHRIIMVDKSNTDESFERVTVIVPKDAMVRFDYKDEKKRQLVLTYIPPKGPEGNVESSKPAPVQNLPT